MTFKLCALSAFFILSASANISDGADFGVVDAPVVTHYATYSLDFSLDGTPAQKQIEALHGETLQINITLDSQIDNCRFYWQAQGMTDYWTTNNVEQTADQSYTAYFTPDMDTGAKIYNCFVGVAGVNYHAAFRLIFRNSPGADPSELALPVKTIDFDKVTVLNPPWETGGSGGSGGVSTNAVNALIADYDQTNITERITAATNAVMTVTAENLIAATNAVIKAVSETGATSVSLHDATLDVDWRLGVDNRDFYFVIKGSEEDK